MNGEYVLIPLSRGLVTAISPEDEESVRKFIWSLSSFGYAFSIIAGSLHRFIAQPKNNLEVDHWNGCVLDNRRINLRVCTRKDQTRNTKTRRSINKTSKYKGVRLHYGGWQVRCVNKLVGTFHSEKEAAVAYDNEARTEFGKFARLNFPNSEEIPPNPPEIIKTQNIIPSTNTRRRMTKKFYQQQNRGIKCYPSF